MKKISTLTKISTATLMLLALSFGSIPTLKAQAANPANWDTTGSYVIALNYNAVDYPHDMTFTQDNLGNLTSGSGGSPAGANTYTWAMTSGTVTGDAIDFWANYTATTDAVTPLTTLHVMGTIAPNGTMSGTWSDNYQAGERAGTFTTVSGAATPASTDDSGTIGGTVSGGNGALAVTSVETTDTDGKADGTFANGWKYTFNITLPTNESHLAMKFSDWTTNPALNTILAANDMRISSAQANNAGATILVTAANTYTTPTLNMTTDLDPIMDGIQVKVLVEVKIPIGSSNGAYSTNYGVNTN